MTVVDFTQGNGREGDKEDGEVDRRKIMKKINERMKGE
jgi:hypothetical protein